MCCKHHVAAAAAARGHAESHAQLTKPGKASGWTLDNY